MSLRRSAFVYLCWMLAARVRQGMGVHEGSHCKLPVEVLIHICEPTEDLEFSNHMRAVQKRKFRIEDET
jgi:hypothetical protein